MVVEESGATSGKTHLRVLEETLGARRAHRILSGDSKAAEERDGA